MWLWTSKLHAIAFTQFSYIALNNSPRTTNYNCIVAPKLSQIFVHLITNICSILLCRVRNKNGKYSRNICDCKSSENFILPVRHFFSCVCVRFSKCFNEAMSCKLLLCRNSFIIIVIVITMWTVPFYWFLHNNQNTQKKKREKKTSKFHMSPHLNVTEVNEIMAAHRMGRY